jgi:hypothetical protein
VAADLVPLSAAASRDYPLRGFKVDLNAAYRQLHARRADRWQQQIFWRFPVNGIMRGGWFEDTRMMWGGKRAGIIFHRAVTSLVVLFIHNKLQTHWLPTIADPTTLEWISARRAAGFTPQQQLPAIVKGFLDDFFFFIDLRRRPLSLHPDLRRPLPNLRKARSPLDLKNAKKKATSGYQPDARPDTQPRNCYQQW